MVKLAPRLDWVPEGFSALQFRYNPLFIERLKAYPGANWNPEQRSWLVPEELGQELVQLGAKFGVKPQLFQKQARGAVQYTQRPSQLRSYQQKSVTTLLQDRRLLLSYEMGLGKTAPAIEAIRASGVGRTLVVCPAGVRTVWLDELGLWWPEHPDTLVISSAVDWGALLTAPKELICITSYNLLDVANQWDFIILDEAHYIKNASSQRAKAAFAVRDANPHAVLLALTGTPIGTEPKDLHALLDWLHPRRFGTFFKFVSRYCNVTHNGYGHDIEGVNEDHVDELRARLASVSHRVVEAEVSHLLPPFTVQAVRYRAKNDAKHLSNLTRQWLLARDSKTRKKIELALYLGASAQKAACALEQLEEALDAQVSHIVISTHLKETACAIYEALPASAQKAYIDGSVLPAKRVEIIDGLALRGSASSPAVLVCTLHSVKEGLNSLANFGLSISAEMSYSPLEMAQYLKRFNRLNSKHASKALLLVLEGTPDEQVASALKRRTEAINQIYKAGGAEEKLNTALNEEDTDEEFAAKCRQAAKSQQSSDGY